MPETALPTSIYDQESIGSLPKRPQVEKLLIEWTAPSRPYKVRSREFYTTIASIAFLLGIILLLLKEFLLIGVIIAFAFLSYVLASVKPEDAVHQITTRGIRTDGKLFEWEGLTNFWIKKQWSTELVMCKTQKTVPGIIMLVLDAKKREEIIKIISSYIPLEKPDDSFVDRAGKWLGDKVPLENS